MVFSDNLSESSGTLAIAGKLVRTGLRVLLVGDEVGGKDACCACLGDTVVISNESLASRRKLTDAVETREGEGWSQSPRVVSI
jgi:hypothetical protein